MDNEGRIMTSFVVTSIHVSMPIDIVQWDKLVWWDDDNNDDTEFCISELVDRLDNVWDCDYNGHFGQQILFRADDHAAAEKACLYIESLIGKHND